MEILDAVLLERAPEGSIAQKPLEDPHPDFTGLGTLKRHALWNLSSGEPRVVLDWLRRNGYEAEQYGEGYRIAVKKAGSEDPWQVIDPKGLDLGDLGDVLGDVYKGALATGGGLLGGALGLPSGPGAVASMAAGAALGGGLGEAILSTGGRALGLRPSAEEQARSIALETGIGAAGEVGGALLGPVIKGGREAARGAATGVRSGIQGLTRTRAELGNFITKAPLAVRQELGERLATGSTVLGKPLTSATPEELAYAAWERQPGAKAQQKRMGEEVHRLLEETTGQPIKAKVWTRGMSETVPTYAPREFKGATYGPLERHLPENLRFESPEAVLQDFSDDAARMRVYIENRLPEAVMPEVMKDLEPLSPEELAKWIFTHQRGYVADLGSTMPRNFREQLSTVSDPETRFFDPYKGFRSIAAEGVERLEVGGKTLDYSQPTRGQLLTRRLLGAGEPGSTDVLTRIGQRLKTLGSKLQAPVERVAQVLPGRLGRMARGATPGAKRIGAIGALYFGAPGQAFDLPVRAAAGAWLGGDLLQGVGSVLQREEGNILERILGSPTAPTLVRRLAEKILNLLSTRGKESAQAALYILLHNPEFQKWWSEAESRPGAP